MLVAAALLLSCVAIDGDTMRCGDVGRVRLYAIDAPELPGHCRQGRSCVEGDPYAAKDALAAMIADRQVICQSMGTDRYGRMLARCTAGEVDLSCALVAAGHAIERYARLNCN